MMSLRAALRDFQTDHDVLSDDTDARRWALRILTNNCPPESFELQNELLLHSGLRVVISDLRRAKALHQVPMGLFGGGSPAFRRSSRSRSVCDVLHSGGRVL